MTRLLLKPGQIVTMDPARAVIVGGGILVEGNGIREVMDRHTLPPPGRFAGEVLDLPSLTAIPGFIQTHLHLCQTLFRGLADDLDLLEWLKLRIFPLEAAHNAASMYASALLGIAELIRSGTTTIMDMGSVHGEEEIVRAIDETGLRAFVGKAMMDVNDVYPSLRESTRDAISSTRRQAELWHGYAQGRIRYAVAPRFVLSCSEELLREASAMTRDFPGMLFHTHASENGRELAAVRERCGMAHVEYLESIGTLLANTCLVHCVHVDDREIDLIRERNAKVLHCPSSNLKLGSGIARIPEFLRKGVVVSLGTDGAPCNNTLDMFHEMRLAALIQGPTHGAGALSARAVFEMATRGGAAALGLDREIGTIENGKRADIVLLDLNDISHPLRVESDDTDSAVVYSSSPAHVHSVMVDGRWVYRDHEFCTIDEAQVRRTAQVELDLLLRRCKA